MRASNSVWWEKNVKGNILVHDNLSHRKLELKTDQDKEMFLSSISANEEDILQGDGFVPEFLESDVLSLFD